MTTTAIVAEIVIAGLQALFWASLLVLTLFGTGWIEVEAFDGWEALVTIFVLAAAYVLGILVDRAADTGQTVLGGVWPEAAVDKPERVGVMRAAVYAKGGDAATFIDYQRSRLRVVRSTVLNLLLAAVVVPVFLGVRTGAGWGTALGVAALLVLALVLAQFAYRRIQVAWMRALVNAFFQATGTKPPPPPEIAAAVPYRGLDRPELLLVRTKGRKGRWTFPKGHREGSDASLAEAAAREAREEAGLEGAVERELGTFRYPGREGETDVRAFLFRVEQDGLKRPWRERRRKPTWVSPEEAAQLLAAGGREERYAEGMQAVLARALEAIAARG